MEGVPPLLIMGVKIRSYLQLFSLPLCKISLINSSSGGHIWCALSVGRKAVEGNTECSVSVSV